MKKINFIIFALTTAVLGFLPSRNFAFATTSLSINEKDITFSENNIAGGDLVRIYCKVLNTGDADVSGFVVFSDNGKNIGAPQQFNARPNDYGDVWTDWQAVAGNHSITAEIIGTNPSDGDPQSDTTAPKIISISSPATQNNTSVSADSTVGSILNQTANNYDAGGSDSAGTDNTDASPSFLSNIQNGIENFSQSNPIKSGIAAFNNSINNQVHHLVFGGNSDTGPGNSSNFNPTQFTASLLDSLKSYFDGNKTATYIVLGILSLIILFFLFSKGRRNKYRNDEYDEEEDSED